MAKKKSKVDIIAAYIDKHPDATWKSAAPDLERKGINGSYFASQRSKLKSQGTAAEEEKEEDALPLLLTSDEFAPMVGVKKKRGPQKRGTKGAVGRPKGKAGSKRASIASAAGDISNLAVAAEFRAERRWRCPGPSPAGRTGASSSAIIGTRNRRTLFPSGDQDESHELICTNSLRRELRLLQSDHPLIVRDHVRARYFR